MEEPLQIRYRHVASTPVIDALVREKATRLEAFYRRITACRVTLEAPQLHHRRGGHYRVRIELSVPGEELVTRKDPGRTSDYENLYLAVCDAFRAARRQLQACKGKSKTSPRRYPHHSSGIQG